jgi:hypothetical protein
MSRYPLLLLVLLPMSLACTQNGGRAAAPAPNPATAPALRAVSFVRNRVGVANDLLKVTVDPDGAYQITRRGGGGANSTTRGQLTAPQQRDLARAFSGWSDLENYYSPPGGVEEEFRFEIEYSGKMIVASDAAKNLPPQIREVYRQVRELVSRAGML